MTPSEKSPDSEQNLRWRAWEEKNRRQDSIAEKRMKVVFVVLGVILLILLVYASRQAIEQPNSVKKGPTVACQWRTAPLPVRPECGKSLEPA